MSFINSSAKRPSTLSSNVEISAESVPAKTCTALTAEDANTLANRDDENGRADLALDSWPLTEASPAFSPAPSDLPSRSQDDEQQTKGPNALITAKSKAALALTTLVCSKALPPAMPIGSVSPESPTSSRESDESCSTMSPTLPPATVSAPLKITRAIPEALRGRISSGVAQCEKSVKKVFDLFCTVASPAAGVFKPSCNNDPEEDAINAQEDLMDKWRQMRGDRSKRRDGNGGNSGGKCNNENNSECDATMEANGSRQVEEKGCSDNLRKRKADNCSNADDKDTNPDVIASSDSSKKSKRYEHCGDANEANCSDANGGNDIEVEKCKSDECFTVGHEINCPDVNDNSENFQKRKVGECFATEEDTRSDENENAESFKKRKVDECFIADGEVKCSGENEESDCVNMHKADECCIDDPEVNSSNVNGNSDSFQTRNAAECPTAEDRISCSDVKENIDSFNTRTTEECFTAGDEVKCFNVNGSSDGFNLRKADNCADVGVGNANVMEMLSVRAARHAKWMSDNLKTQRSNVEDMVREGSNKAQQAIVDECVMVDDEVQESGGCEQTIVDECVMVDDEVKESSGRVEKTGATEELPLDAEGTNGNCKNDEAIESHEEQSTANDEALARIIQQQGLPADAEGNDMGKQSSDRVKNSEVGESLDEATEELPSDAEGKDGNPKNDEVIESHEERSTANNNSLAQIMQQQELPSDAEGKNGNRKNAEVIESHEEQSTASNDTLARIIQQQELPSDSEQKNGNRKNDEVIESHEDQSTVNDEAFARIITDGENGHRENVEMMHEEQNPFESHEEQNTANDEALARILQQQDDLEGQVIVID